ncbi:MAG: HD domain-containing phosphohydrolase [Phaeospirillum sp.]|nr:HD domain-containing phosphohydrolase [Phaeospirillum sp.]
MPILIGSQLKRRLALRLCLGGILIATTLGGGVFWYEIERIEHGFVAEAVEQARTLSPNLPSRLDATTAPQVQAALEAFLRGNERGASDHFAGAEIYARDHSTLAEAILPRAGAAAQAIDRTGHVFPDPGESWYFKHVVAGEIYLQVMTGLAAGADGPSAGYFEGLYHVSPAHIADARNAGLRTTILVILSVLATSGLLYPIILQLNSRMVAGSRALLAANIGAIEMLGNAIAKRDSDTNSHNYRVTIYALRLAEAIKLDPGKIRSLIKGAFLHDVGKLAIPDSILLKPGKLDDVEFEIMKTHVSHGLDVVKRFEWLRDAADVVTSHHEKFDGSGYTAGLAGDQIPLNARIFAIADVFDALTSRRPYKEPLPVEQATAIMLAGRGSHFDPSLLDTFFTMAGDLFAEFGSSEDLALDETLRRLSTPYFLSLLAD